MRALSCPLGQSPDLDDSVGSLIQEGRFGSVHEYGRHGAVKLFSCQESFVREMRGYLLVGRHPFVLRVLEFARAGPLPALVSELCCGDLFEAISSRRRMDVTMVSAELALALEHVHARGVAHLDVKPENVLIGPDGHVRLADLGSCRARGSSRGIGGTRIYLSPEQLFRLDTLVGPASDFWQFGCVLYEMFMGIPPFYLPRSQFPDAERTMGARVLGGSWRSSRPGLPPPAACALLDYLLTVRVDNRLADWRVLRRQPFFGRVAWGSLHRERGPFGIRKAARELSEPLGERLPVDTCSSDA